MTLGEYLQSLGGKRRDAARHDCATLPSDWAVIQGFADPMAKWRAAYDSEEGAEQLIADAGGLLAMFEEGYRDIPLRIGASHVGDVAVLSILGAQAGSIFTGERWAFVGERGIGFSPMPDRAILKVWAVGRG